MTGLSRSLDRIKDSYDVIVVGSGYGGGVAASRLARAGKRVAVLERGREVLTGGFPSRFPDLKNELQVTGKRVQTGPSSALYDVRFGEDMHVLVGCGLGGGSLINAGVALRPDAACFATRLAGPDRAGRPARGGLRARSAGCGQPPIRARPRTPSTRHCTVAGVALGQRPVAAPVVVSFDATASIPRASPNPPAHAAATAAGAATSAPRTRSRLTYLARRRAPRREIFTHAGVRHVSKRRRRIVDSALAPPG